MSCWRQVAELQTRNLRRVAEHSFYHAEHGYPGGPVHMHMHMLVPMPVQPPCGNPALGQQDFYQQQQFQPGLAYQPFHSIVAPPMYLHHS